MYKRQIQDGTFASEFLTEMNPNGGRKVHFLAKRRMEAELPIEKVGAEPVSYTHLAAQRPVCGG